MSSWRTAAIVAGLAVLAHPLVGNGPGPDTRYEYSASTVDVTDDETVELLYEHPAVRYGTGQQVETVRTAANGTVVRRESAVDDDLLALTDRTYLADDVGDRYYRLDARVTDGQFRLDAEAVSAATVAAELAVDPDATPRTVQRALDGETTASTRVDATVVDTAGGYRLVRVVDQRQVPDPFAVPKVLAYALAVVAVVAAAVGREESDSRKRQS